jgi:hypothetical protein
VGLNCFVNVKLLTDCNTYSTMDRKRNTKARGRRTLRQKTFPMYDTIRPIKSNIVVKHRYRFSSSAAVNSTITADNVLGAIGTMGTVVNSTVTELAKSCRISQIEIWSPSVSGAVTTCSVDFTSAVVQSANLEFSDTSINVSCPAHVRARPPRQCLASMWQITSANVLFILTCPSGSIIDLDVEYILHDSTSVVNITGLATVVLGKIYYLALNGSTATLVPVSLQTTV